MKHITFFALYIVTPLSIYSMKPTLQLTISPEITQHYEEFDTLCKKSCSMLQNFEQNNIKSAKKLIKVIELTKALKLANITETHLGLSSLAKHHNQQPLLREMTESIKNKFVINQNLVTPFHTALFFNLLSSYNQSLMESTLVLPSIVDVKNHWGIEKRKAIAARGLTFGINIPISTLNAKKILINPSADVESFDHFMANIKAMLLEKPKIIKALAEFIYCNGSQNVSVPSDYTQLEDSTENS